MADESIVCFDYPNCDREHAGGAGGVPVHPPKGSRISGDEPIPSEEELLKREQEKFHALLIERGVIREEPLSFVEQLALDALLFGTVCFTVGANGVPRRVDPARVVLLPEKECVVCRVSLPPEDPHGGLCCAHRYDEQPPCARCSR